ncbi:hypothetical protein PILCRDRAFT_3209 [Piloderma croceum F 1598]|uniref:Uncharacterized protein n=1 Tax=Piloderma croceum (strain F 1598) TaxID=765440 RepID=A0A0C3BNX8_PILCF|nr:hypothetical protein PILCRDRAFT_3209 [Piloderma croceum F 1598]
MDPLSTLTTLTRAINYLWELSEKVKQNREECQHLAAYAGEVLKLIEKKVENGTSSTVSSTPKIDGADELSNQPMLKKILWRARIADKITEAYRSLSEAIQLFDLGEKLDLRRFYEEKETARQVDIENLQKVVEKGNQERPVPIASARALRCHAILPCSPISPSREKHAVSTMWKKIVRSNSQSPRPGYDKHHNPLVRTDVYSPSLGGFDHKAGSPDDPSTSRCRLPILPLLYKRILYFRLYHIWVQYLS